MAGINKVILVGNLGKDPEVRYLEGGVAVAKFPIATSESHKDKQGNKVEHTEWHNIVLWRGLAEVAEKYVRKGMQVYIEGRLRTRAWEDKDKVKRYTTEIMGDQMVILGKKENNPGTSSNASGTENPQTNNPNTNSSADDLPF